MQAGSYVICNDLLGVLIVECDDKMSIRCKDDVVREVSKKSANVIMNPHALALLTYNKLVTRVQEGQNVQ